MARQYVRDSLPIIQPQLHCEQSSNFLSKAHSIEPPLSEFILNEEPKESGAYMDAECFGLMQTHFTSPTK